MSSSDLRLRAEKAEVELEAQIEAGFIVCQAKLREIDALEARIAEQSQEIKRLLAYVDGNDKDVEIGNLEARVKELEELLGEETYAERAAVRHYKRIKELEEGLRECCRMFEWCDTRYGQLLEEK